MVSAGLMERSGAMTDMYDQALLGILQHVGNVQEFLDILFGFLYRKTDFYRLLLQPADRLGFPPGVAKSMALRVSLWLRPLWTPELASPARGGGGGGGERAKVGRGTEGFKQAVGIGL